MQKTKNSKIENLPERLFRQAIMEYELGLYAQSWEHAAQAILMDKFLEQKRRPYKLYMDKIIRHQYGSTVDPARFIQQYRKENQSLINGSRS